MRRAGRKLRRGGSSRASQVAQQAFGARLAAFRAGAALTQSELAGRLGVSRRQIAYYESGNGRPPGALLGLLADLFRVSTDALLGRRVSRARASQLSSAARLQLQKIERMGGDVGRRLEVALEKFIIVEQWRRAPPSRVPARRAKR